MSPSSPRLARAAKLRAAASKRRILAGQSVCITAYFPLARCTNGFINGRRVATQHLSQLSDIAEQHKTQVAAHSAGQLDTATRKKRRHGLLSGKLEQLLCGPPSEQIPPSKQAQQAVAPTKPCFQQSINLESHLTSQSLLSHTGQ